MTWIIAGLGNPGAEYEGTRHNAGRMAVEYFAKKASASAWKEDKLAKASVARASLGKELMALLLPETFMNKSGYAVAKYVKSARAAERLIVVYDDLDLPLGTMKLSYDRGSGGHKGLESIIRAVKTKKFTRVRIGVSPATRSGKPAKPESGGEVLDFILAKFKSSETEELKKVFKKAAEAIASAVTEGPQMAMNRFNTNA